MFILAVPCDRFRHNSTEDRAFAFWIRATITFVGSNTGMYRTGSVSSNGHLRVGGIPVTAITGIAYKASQKETPVIAVISTSRNVPVMW
ncbi:hypothetical protein AVDCRST_MAG94-4369, partial [uncultured Leptolyngbya sp.]